MLILYKSCGFKFSDVEFIPNNTTMGHYRNNDINVLVHRKTTSPPDLYYVEIYYKKLNIYRKTTLTKNEAEIEVIVNQAMSIFRHVNTI